MPHPSFANAALSKNPVSPSHHGAQLESPLSPKPPGGLESSGRSKTEPWPGKICARCTVPGIFRSLTNKCATELTVEGVELKKELHSPRRLEEQVLAKNALREAKEELEKAETKLKEAKTENGTGGPGQTAVDAATENIKAATENVKAA